MKIIEISCLDQLPVAPKEKRYFVCIGGSKNYQCYLSDKNLSRADFMNQYTDIIPFFLRPLYEDINIQVRLDSTYAVPGFCIISPWGNYRTVHDLPENIFLECVKMSTVLAKYLYQNDDVKNVYVYYDEHYKKAASAHFWVLPIYSSHLNGMQKPTIDDMSVWNYMESFEYQKESKSIQEHFFKIKEHLKKYGV